MAGLNDLIGKIRGVPSASASVPTLPAPVVAEEPAPTPASAPAAEPTPAGPKYAEGAAVACSTPGMPPGKVTGMPVTEPVYTITPDDGTAPYKAPESTLMEPSEEPDMEDEPMPTDTAPAALADLLGLPKGATNDQALTAVAGLKSALATATAEARDAALVAAGVVPDLKDLAAGALVRGEGQTWTDAVKAQKDARPSLYRSEAPAAAPAPAAPVGPSAPLPAGASLPGGTPPAARVSGGEGPVILNGGAFRQVQ